MDKSLDGEMTYEEAERTVFDALSRYGYSAKFTDKLIASLQKGAPVDGLTLKPGPFLDAARSLAAEVANMPPEVQAVEVTAQGSGFRAPVDGEACLPNPHPSEIKRLVDLCVRYGEKRDDAAWEQIQDLKADITVALRILRRLRSHPKPEGDGEAGDLGNADSEREAFDAWIKATPCKAHWTHRHIAWLAWIERAGRAARLSPAPKQGAAESLLHDMAAYKTNLEGKIAKVHSLCVQYHMRKESRFVQAILAIIEGQQAGEGGNA
jgi:hypothetical protein